MSLPSIFSMNCIKEKVITTDYLINNHFGILTTALLSLGLLRLSGLCFETIIVADLKHASSDWYLSTHDNAFCDALDSILLALDG